MNPTKSVFVAASVLSIISVSGFAGAANAGTMTFDLTNWQFLNSGTSNSNSVNLSTAGTASDTAIENFLGLSNGSLDALIAANATAGSAAKTTITAKAGDVVNFNWSFATSDYAPFNDFGFFSINNAATLLSSVQSVGNYGSTTSNPLSYTFAADGTYTLGFGVLDTIDTSVDSTLAVNKITQKTSVPEPGSLVGLLAVTLIGGGSLLKQRKA